MLSIERRFRPWPILAIDDLASHTRLPENPDPRPEIRCSGPLWNVQYLVSRASP